MKKKGFINPYLGGFLLGVVLFISFAFSGNGLGASGALSRLTAFIQDIFASDHINQTPYLIKMAGGDTNPLNHWIVYLVGGTIVGGFLSGWISGRVKVETIKGPQISNKKRWVLAFIGGALMGYGARFARGCTSGQALSGGSVLSAGSWLFMFSVFAGAYALAYFFRKNWN